MALSWAIFETFRRPVDDRSWSGVVEWKAAPAAPLGPGRRTIARLRRASDQLLVALGADPSARDWTSFRPLRRDREEDWSDWLAQLIEESRTGRFAWALLGRIEG